MNVEETGGNEEPVENETLDLVITGGTVIDPGNSIHDRLDIGVKDGLVAEISSDLSGRESRRYIDATGLLVTPGLVDVHTHLYVGVSHYGIDADETCLAHGVTTAVDAGSSGAQTVAGFRRYVIDEVETNVLAFLNLSALGMITPLVGELEDLRYADPDAAVKAATEHSDVIVGIKVRVDGKVVGGSALPALAIGRTVADQLGLPMMVHILGVNDPLPAILQLLSRGDVVTHCFHGGWNGILDGNGKLVSGVREAAKRGVLFDVGHGAGSFAFSVARRALDNGLVPDTISSDLHRYNVNGPVLDLVTTLSKMMYLGMELDEVLARATSRPAAAIGRYPSVGTLGIGVNADIAVLELREGGFRLEDSTERSVQATKRLETRHVVRLGHVITAGVPGAQPSTGHKQGHR
jgi:dihydroorotase